MAAQGLQALLPCLHLRAQMTLPERGEVEADEPTQQRHCASSSKKLAAWIVRCSPRAFGSIDFVWNLDLTLPATSGKAPCPDLPTAFYEVDGPKNLSQSQNLTWLGEGWVTHVTRSGFHAVTNDDSKGSEQTHKLLWNAKHSRSPPRRLLIGTVPGPCQPAPAASRNKRASHSQCFIRSHVASDSAA